jgi:hypothetical protein
MEMEFIFRDTAFKHGLEEADIRRANVMTDMETKTGRHCGNALQ